MLTDNDHLVAIAHVAVRSAQLDHTIELTLAEMLRPDLNTAEMVVKNLPQARQIEFLGSLLKDRYPGYGKEVNHLIDRITELRRERNIVIHYIWAEIDPDGAAMLKSIRPFRRGRTETRSASEIESVADGLHRCVEDLYKIIYVFRERQIQERHGPHHAAERFLWPLSPGS